jgi:hypothetical protein
MTQNIARIATYLQKDVLPVSLKLMESTIYIPAIRHPFPLSEQAGEPAIRSHTAALGGGGHEHGPLLSRRAQIGCIVGNIAIGAVETTASFAAYAFSGVSDGIHNAMDAGAYWLQFKVAGGKLTETQERRYRKLSYWLLSGVSAGLASKVVVDMAMGYKGEPNAIHTYAAGASLALNAALLANMYRQERRRKNLEQGTTKSAAEKDIYKHFLQVDVPSSVVALFGAVTHRYGLPLAEQAATVLGCLYGVWAFRPTTKNLDNCDHGHSMSATAAHHHDEHDHAHAHHHSHSKPKCDQSRIGRIVTDRNLNESQKPTRRRKLRMVLAGMVALTLAGIPPSAGQIVGEQSVVATPDKAATVPEAPLQVQPARPAPLAVTSCMTAKEGDSMWKLSARRIREVTGVRAGRSMTNIVTVLSAHASRRTNPDPGLIGIDTCVQVPTPAAIRTIKATLEGSPSSTLASDLRLLNQQPTMEYVLQQQGVLQRITQTLTGAP